MVTWLLALKDAIDIAGRSPERFDIIGPVRDQPTINCVKAKRVDSGQLVARREPEDQIATKCNSAPCYDQATIARVRELIDAALKFSSAARAIGTACCLSFAALVTSADTMICSAPSTTA